ncbi:hypothetical protein AC249_AIPGENE27549 [Exaiptasia diaphana]|nr:hypothetical protein AC249_AIPGENE27549 [Exaiptasia diaphana]
MASLTENDIPGASFNGRNESEMKNDELRFWLKCRGDSGKGQKTKAELVKRVEEYINSGRDKNIVDPDPNKIYTRRKQQHAQMSLIKQQDDRRQVPIKYPEQALEKMPLLTKAEMDEHKTKLLLESSHSYEARVDTSYKQYKINKLMEDLRDLDPNMALSQMVHSNEPDSFIETTFGVCPVGSVASYQLTFAESNFSTHAELSSMDQRAPVALSFVISFLDEVLNKQIKF